MTGELMSALADSMTRRVLGTALLMSFKKTTVRATSDQYCLIKLISVLRIHKDQLFAPDVWNSILIDRVRLKAR